MLAEVEHDERLNGISDGLGVDDGAIGLDDALFFEIFDTIEHGAFGESVLGGEFLIGNISLSLKGFEDILVELIHGFSFHGRVIWQGGLDD